MAAIVRGLAVAPEDPRLLVMRGNLAAKHGNFDAALAEYDRVLQKTPQSAQAWLGKGKVLGGRGENAGALRAFQQAAEFDTTSFEAHYNAGALLLSMNNVPAAMPYLVRAYEHRGSAPAGATLRATLLQLPIQSADTYVELATADADRKDFDGALEWLARALTVDKDNGPALFLQGGMLNEKGDKPGALRAWKRACEILPDSLLAATATGTLLAELGNPEEARTYLSNALAIAEKAAAGSAEAREAIPLLKQRIAGLGGGGK
jgi:tetratricopeptide (TPR) repeat protein